MTAGRPDTEPRTEAGRLLADEPHWHNPHCAWLQPSPRACDCGLPERIVTIEAEAAQGAAPRAEGLRALVDEQAEDEGLWFNAATASEAYLQQELRRLHAAIEAAPRAEGLDVERLEQALANLDLPATRLSSRAIRDEYARLSRPSDDREGESDDR